MGADFVQLDLTPMLIGILAAIACALPGNFLIEKRRRFPVARSNHWSCRKRPSTNTHEPFRAVLARFTSLSRNSS